MSGTRYTTNGAWGTDLVNTLATGTAFVGLNDQPADEVALFLPASDVPIDVLCTGQADATKFVTHRDTQPLVLPLAGNAMEVQVRRNDQGAETAIRYVWRRWRR